MQTIRFDDLTTLRALAAEEFGPFGAEVTITQEMIDRFADLTGDRQWIHVDVERARRESPYRGTIAHGFLVLSLVPVLRRRADRQITGYANIVNYGSDRLRFVKPVAAGQTVHARSRLVAVEEKPKGVMLSEEIQVSVLGAEGPALSYVMLALYQGERKGE